MVLLTTTVSAQALWQWRSLALQSGTIAGVDQAGVDWLLREVAHLDRLTLHLSRPRDLLSLACSLDTLQDLWQRHCETRTPLQYLVGWVTWRNLRLQVNPNVLIPRPETELLVDLALEALKQQPDLTTGAWVDLGTGSGAIPLALAREAPLHGFTALQLHGVDCSEAALAIAKANAAHSKLSPDKIHWHQGSWFSPFQAWQNQGLISVMLSNPPYIPSAEIQQLDPEVRDHEPHLALDGGTDGLQALNHLMETAPHYLRSGGLWLVEVMAGQGPIVARALEALQCYTQIQIHPDLEGSDRFVAARLV